MITQIPMPSTLNSLVTPSLCIAHPPTFSFSPPITSSLPFTLPSPSRRRCFRFQASSSLVVPLLPVSIHQVLIPSEAKTLHLYEARYIALLEELLLKKDKLLVHFVLDQIDFRSTSVEASFVANYGCLAIIEKVEHRDVGALISLRGVGRVKILHICQVSRCLRLLVGYVCRKLGAYGLVIPLQDNVYNKMADLNSKVSELKKVLCSLNSLEIKLKAPGEAMLQTQTMSSLVWAERQLSLDCDHAPSFIPPLAERVSFAALQPISGANPAEMFALQREKLIVMEISDTLERLEKSVNLARKNIAVVAAKLAIQSLGTL
ncbi:uncharacterized protein LOC127257123 isoform X1 [Andrographis paniculata]|uniref:uncharacterized protein LOC127257123 isoform X1 n=1 Tax=Andrographis paniculata TaxID=175694 RepID=UPI0021E8B59B|nr:uncharacterized protein LOC127257123 isoform X1 [Andrographis paniculata]XP_051139397.1 uncharacterized protein LOC127257123 isoform X1 [Andrographis paniculata]XP_051139398.1 uncharacterized protein LOC127257123 isoform X1 [Andrographis paniculata]XP_051139399.1 uncharacterized protein LOC127257123 isoform X1 [Andrographis paniculata]XP_051139400.1 uncharacterized protein LOC127257123 isoform X1 [Andrographis paniculata]